MKTSLGPLGPSICWVLFAFFTFDANAMQLPDVESSSYQQTVIINFRDSTAADQATVALAPLFDDYHRAVSCRWDDNWTSDNSNTRDLMEEYGIRGTWYLNDRTFSPDKITYGDYAPVARELLKGGNSIGGHSLTHPYLTYFHHNRMFAEMAGVRIVWESALDRPVHSYAYSFVDMRPEPEGRLVLQRSIDTLAKAGYYHVSEYLNFFEDLDLQLELSPIMPPENNTLEVFRKAVDWAYNDQTLTQKFPMITNSMHAWYGTPRLPYGYDELRKRFEILSQLKDVWHCNQNQYAAYRRQFSQTTLKVEDRIENSLRIRIRRPTIDQLNDSTPLTLKIQGVKPQDIVNVLCDGTDLPRTDRNNLSAELYHIPHASHQKLPIRISHYSNPENLPDRNDSRSDNDFPTIEGRLHVANGNLNLQMQWSNQQSLDRVRVTWRTPLGWKVDQQRRQVETQNEVHQLNLSQPLHHSDVPDSRWGQTHFAAQVDFFLDNQPGRIHFTTRIPGESPDESLPAKRFGVLGPIANDVWDTDRFVQQLQQGKEDLSWLESSDESLNWRISSDDGYIQRAWMNPEYVVTTGTWDITSPTYVLRSNIHSEKSQPVQIVTSHATQRTLVLNGSVVDSETVELQAGENRLVVIYPGSTLGVTTQRLAACFIRLADPKTGQRITNIRYQPY